MAHDHLPSERSEKSHQAPHTGITEPNWASCPSCDGLGDYGLDDEDRQLICYTCYGVGSIDARRLEEDDK
jgi:DnaJ-class molecular chaperone